MFLEGFLCGIGGTAVVWLTVWLVRHGVEKPGGCRRRYAQTWAETRNFLCYDGSVMPVVKAKKEETYVKNK